MVIAGKYCFNDGLKRIKNKYSHLLDEIYEIISGINASEHKTKESMELRINPNKAAKP